MSKAIEDLMKTHGPCLSTDLTKRLVSKLNISEVAARKRVSRKCAGLKSLAHLPFPKKARFLYLQQDYGSPQYWDALKAAILNHSPAYGPALASVMQRNGVMPKSHFSIACGAPLRQQKHLSAETILDRLKLANIFDVVEVPGIGSCVALAEITNNPLTDYSHLRARLITEDILLKAIRMWIRNLGLASYDKVKVRGEDSLNPTVGTFAWDLTGPSYLAAMAEWGKTGKPSPGFIACDVLSGSAVNEIGIRPFLQKCSTLRNLKRVGRCLQIFVADSYTPEAFRLAKAAGIVPATTETLFGSEVAQGLAQLTDVLTQAARASINPEIFDELFQRLGRIEGAAGNMRGALFEFLVAELVRQSITSNVELNRIFRAPDGAKAEVDIVAVKTKNSVHFIECKGHQPSGLVDDEEVDLWLTKRVPLVRRYALGHPDWNTLQLNFEFWTTGTLSEESKNKLDKAKAAINPNKYSIEYRDADKVKAYAKMVNDPSLTNTLNKHFLKHPMATAEHDVKNGHVKKP